jgi:DNA polymerase III delta prime subunit
VILDEVHQLSNDAFAALLKTLEEPPPHLVFIFATTDPQKLPDTIRSRCQRFDFARVPLRRVAERLQEIRAREAKDPEGVKFTLSEGAALLIAHKSEGSMRDAVSALDQVVSAGEPEVTRGGAPRARHRRPRGVLHAGGAISARDPQARCARSTRRSRRAWTRASWPRGWRAHPPRADPQGGSRGRRPGGARRGGLSGSRRRARAGARAICCGS